jgi:hypothetical protein
VRVRANLPANAPGHLCQEFKSEARLYRRSPMIPASILAGYS